MVYLSVSEVCVSQLCIYYIFEASNLIDNQAISKAKLINREVTISFSRYLL